MNDLNALRRRRDLTALADDRRPLDVLVIGGGITGVGVALDAATRGLRVALVEAADLASGTSRWSSKLVHGGLRYLGSGQLAIARESAVERHHLMTTIAPHLVTPLRQVVPDFGHRRQMLAIRIGFRAGDLLRRSAGTSDQVLPPPVPMTRRETLQRCPTVRRDGLRGGVGGSDGQLIDDARLVVAVARTAAANGAAILTRVRADQVTGTSARLTDTLTGESFEVATRSVVNATGVWAGDVEPALSVRPSRGTHLVFDAATFGHPTAALTVPIDGSVSRFVFALPEQLGRVYVGLTDVDAPGPIPDVPMASDDEIDTLIGAINVALERPVGRGDVIGTFAGLRPLVDSRPPIPDGAPVPATGADDLADVSRRHLVRVSGGTLVSVVGGKLTTYRRMAQDALDAAIASAGLDGGRCVTAATPLIGALGPRSCPTLPPSLVARYGSEAEKVVRIATVDEPLAPIADGIDVTRAEVEFALTHEGACDADDVVHRRTRIGLVAADAERVRPAVEEIVEAADQAVSQADRLRYNGFGSPSNAGMDHPGGLDKQPRR